MKKLRAFLDRVRLAFARVQVHYFLRVDRAAKCPACGMRKKHPVRFDVYCARLLHKCEYYVFIPLAPEGEYFFFHHTKLQRVDSGCGAIWSEHCIMDPAHWSTIYEETDENGAKHLTQPVFASAQREPMREPQPIARSKTN